MKSITKPRRRQPPAPWIRTISRRPCPVCHAADCLLSGTTDPEAAICTRITSDVPVGTVGYLHRLHDRGPTWAPWRRSLAKLKGTVDG